MVMLLLAMMISVLGAALFGSLEVEVIVSGIRVGVTKTSTLKSPLEALQQGSEPCPGVGSGIANRRALQSAVRR